MKQRSISKGLILAAASSEAFDEVLQGLPLDQQDEMLASWPGPHTWLVPHRGCYPPWVTGNSTEVAIRVTSAPALSALCDAFGGALVSTSANPAGLPPPHTMWELRRYFGAALPALPAAIDRRANHQQYAERGMERLSADNHTLRSSRWMRRR